MKPGLFGLMVGVAAVTVSGCKSDPTASNAGSPAQLVMSFAAAKVRVDDSELVTTKVFDATGAPIVASIAVSTCNSRIVTVVPTSAAPLTTQTNFFAKGDSFAVTCVVATSGALRDTMSVATFPDRIKLFGRDTIVSGTTQKYTWQYLSKSGRDITLQVTGPRWSTDSVSRGAIAAATADTGLLTGKDVGPVSVAGYGPGIPDSIGDHRPVLVIPAAFVGTSTPASAAPTDTLTLTAGAGNPPFDANTSITVNGGKTFVISSSATTLQAIMPPLGAAGPVTFLVKYGKPITLVEQPSLSSSTASFVDRYGVPADSFFSAPTITNGTYYVVVWGKCIFGGAVEGGTVSPGDHCDRWFRLAGSAVKDDTITATLNWLNPQNTGGPELDVLGWDAPNPPSFSDICVVDGCVGGTTTKTPQVTKFIIPKGLTYWVDVNFANPKGFAAQLGKLTIAGL